MDIQAPKSLKTPLRTSNVLLMGPGPANCSPRVLNALSQAVMGHMHQECFQVMDEIKDGLRYVFQTKNQLTLALSTSGHGGMEAVMCNLVEKGDRVLIAVNGIWGERASEMARRNGANVLNIQTELGNNFTYAQLEAAVHRLRPKLLFIVQGESSTGVYQPLDGLGSICHRYNCLLAVDAVASLCGVPLKADQWEIDVVYSGSQKCLGGTPGLTPITFSPRALNVILSRKSPVPIFYLDMKILGDQWNCFGNPRFYHHTVSSNLLCGLREALAIISEEGLENVIKRHQGCAERLHEGLEKLGFNLFVKESFKRLPTVTTIEVPQGVDWKFLTTYTLRNFRLEISGGLGPTVGKVLRIGLMGYNATPENVDLALSALGEAYKRSKSKL